MTRIYPNIDGEKEATSGTCMKCGVALSKNNVGKAFNVEVSYFNGEDEEERYCKQHAHERRTEIRAIHDRYHERRLAAQSRDDQFMDSLCRRLSEKYDVKQLTIWQWRINGVLDVYPKNKRYHDIKRNRRGDYQDIFRLCERFFASANALPAQ